MSQEPCECLKEWDVLGIVFVYLAMLRNDPSGYALQLTITSGEWKGKKIWALSLVNAQGSHSAFRKVLRCCRNPEGQVCHFPRLPCVPAELLGWFLCLPAALWHDRVFAWQTSLASGPPTALTDINFPQCRQSVGCFSPDATSCITPSCLSFSYFWLSYYFFITKKNTCLPMGCKKGLASIHLFCCF